MRKIREVLRLRFAQGLSQRAIGHSLGLSTGAVNTCLGRARRAGLRVDKAALAFSEAGRVRFYGTRDLVEYLVKGARVNWTHTLDV
jgi:predicted transcriptional regulator